MSPFTKHAPTSLHMTSLCSARLRAKSCAPRAMLGRDRPKIARSCAKIGKRSPGMCRNPTNVHMCRPRCGPELATSGAISAERRPGSTRVGRCWARLEKDTRRCFATRSRSTTTRAHYPDTCIKRIRKSPNNNEGWWSRGDRKVTSTSPNSHPHKAERSRLPGEHGCAR